MRSILAITIVATLAAATQADQVVYSNINDVQSYASWATNGELTVDDLHVSGGGALSGLSFVIGSNRWGGPITTDATVTLAVDDGNGTYGAEDTPLLSANLRGLVAPNPGPQGQMNSAVIDVPLDSSAPMIPAGATIWAGVEFTAPARLMLCGTPTPGMTDDYVYALGTAHSVSDYGYPGAGTGWQITVSAEPASALLLSLGLLAWRRR